jgi:RNA recognition motif-containing protein
MPFSAFTTQGFCYINYSAPEVAAAAIEQFNGIELPPHSGHRIKVMYAEPLGSQQQQRSSGSGRSSPAISLYTTSTPSPTRNMSSQELSGALMNSQELLAVQESLSGISTTLCDGGSTGGTPEDSRMATPASSSGETITLSCL